MRLTDAEQVAMLNDIESCGPVRTDTSTHLHCTARAAVEHGVTHRVAELWARAHRVASYRADSHDPFTERHIAHYRSRARTALVRLMAAREACYMAACAAHN